MTTKPTGTGETLTLDVSILGRDYKVACKADEEPELRDAVAFLEGRMREIRENSKTSSVERVAVMAALNLAHDFQRRPAPAPSSIAASTSSRRQASAEAPVAPAALDSAEMAAVRRRIAGMQSAIDQILPAKEKLF
jgi:cell division protein ZapA (FtsZ GTPase activity inhibitor)